MGTHFFAVINRMKYITRWGLMRNTVQENLQEHSFQVAVLAHALALIDKNEFNAQVNPDRAAVMALYHDASEIVTGDMPTPVKYYSQELRDVYKQIEQQANDLLLTQLPPSLRGEYAPLLHGCENCAEGVYVKTADTLSAYIKCVEELKAGNEEFRSACRTLHEKLMQNELPSLKLFLKEFADSYALTLDDQVSLRKDL